MKKTILLALVTLLFSCSKEEKPVTVSYSLNGVTQDNSKFEKTYYNKLYDYVQYSFTINDTTTGFFVLSTQSNTQYCFSAHRVNHTNGVVKEAFIDNKMKGSYNIVNGVVNGIFTGSNNNYIQFKEYKI